MECVFDISNYRSICTVLSGWELFEEYFFLLLSFLDDTHALEQNQRKSCRNLFLAKTANDSAVNLISVTPHLLTVAWTPYMQISIAYPTYTTTKPQLFNSFLHTFNHTLRMFTDI